MNALERSPSHSTARDHVGVDLIALLEIDTEMAHARLAG